MTGELVTAVTSPRFWHPAGVLGQSDAVFRWSFPLGSERPPATLYQPCGLASVGKLRENVQTPARLEKRRSQTPLPFKILR